MSIDTYPGICEREAIAASVLNPEGHVLDAREVRVHIRGVRAVDGVDLTLRQGDILGLIGPNGAGKTTLVNLLAGFQRATSGRVVLSGEDITTWEPSEIARAGVVRTFQNVRLFAGLSVFENVEAAAVSAGLSRRRGSRAQLGDPRAPAPSAPSGPAGRRPDPRRGTTPGDRACARGAPHLPPARRAGRRARRGRVGCARGRLAGIRDAFGVGGGDRADIARSCSSASGSRSSTTARPSRSARRRKSEAILRC